MWESVIMFEETFTQLIIINAINSNLIILVGIFEYLLLFSALAFIGLLIWSSVLYSKEKKLNPTSKKYLPRVIGFSYGFILAVIALLLFFIYLS